jgi:hypothetical protein
MAHLLLIDDDPALIPKLVRQVFPGPAHRVEVAGTGAEASSGSVPCRRTSFSSTCACPTSPAWGSAGRSVARFGVVAEWHLDFHKLQPEIGIERYRGPGSDGG